MTNTIEPDIEPDREITDMLDTFAFQCTESQPAVLAMFKLTPIGLTAAWNANWSCWTDICACKTNTKKGAHSSLPRSDTELFVRLHGQVAAFNRRLTSAAFRTDDKMLDAAFSETPGNNKTTEWVYGFLTTLLLDRLLWSAEVDCLVVEEVDFRTEQTPHMPKAVLHPFARRLHRIYTDWPETICSLLDAWDDAGTFHSAQVSTSCDRSVIGSLVRGANESRANARLATVEENFCVAALGVIGISMCNKPLSSSNLAKVLLAAAGTSDPSLTSMKNSEIVRAAFTAASLSIICLLDGLALTKSGSFRVPLNALIDCTCYPAPVPDPIRASIEGECWLILREMVQHGRHAFKQRFPRAIRRWRGLIPHKSATGSSLDWEKALCRTKQSNSVSYQAGELLKALVRYKGADVDLPMALGDPGWLHNALKSYENVMQALVCDNMMPTLASAEEHGDETESNTGSLRQTSATPRPDDAHAGEGERLVNAIHSQRPLVIHSTPQATDTWQVVISKPVDPGRVGFWKEQTVCRWKTEHRSLKYWPSMDKEHKIFGDILHSIVPENEHTSVVHVYQSYWNHLSEDKRRETFGASSIHIVDDLQRQPHHALQLKGWPSVRSLVNILEDRLVVDLSETDARIRKAPIETFINGMQVYRASVLHFPDVQMQSDYLASDVMHFDDAICYAGQNTSQHIWRTKADWQALGTRTLSISNASVMLLPFARTNGLGGFDRCVIGSKLMFIGEDDGTSWPSKWQRFLLNKGDSLLIQPGTIVASVVVEDCLVLHAQFYTTVTLSRTLRSVISAHYFCDHSEDQDGPRAQSPIALFKLLEAWVLTLRNGCMIWRVPDNHEAASLILLLDHIDQLASTENGLTWCQTRQFKEDYEHMKSLLVEFCALVKTPDFEKLCADLHREFRDCCDEYNKMLGDETAEERVDVQSLSNLFTRDVIH